MRGERALHVRPGVNRLSDQDLRASGTTMVPVDQQRRALEHRLELAKERLVADLSRVSSMLKSSAGSMRRNMVRAAVTIGGLLLLGIVSALVRRRRRIASRLL